MQAFTLLHGALECQLGILAVGKAMQSLEESDMDLLFEAQELMFEANDVKDEATAELLDTLEKYGLDVSDFYK